jgi:tetratricopeptide (TPR) repeat protein
MSGAPSALAWRLDSRLREVPVDPAAFAAAVDARVDEITAARSQPARLLAMLAEAAPLLRIAGRLEEARRTASAAIALAELLEDPHTAYLGRIHLAQVMHWEKRYELSTPLFDQLVGEARCAPALADQLDTVLDAAGKNLLDQGHGAEAARCFRESLRLRRAKGDGELMEASAEALRVASAGA